MVKSVVVNPSDKLGPEMVKEAVSGSESAELSTEHVTVELWDGMIWENGAYKNQKILLPINETREIPFNPFDKHWIIIM